MRKKRAANVLTAEQVAKFHARALHWQKVIGLLDWRFEMGGGKAAKGAMAEVHISYPDRFAEFRTGDFGGAEISDESIDETASHEVFHVLLYELKNAKEIGLEGEALDGAEHRVINILEALVRNPALIKDRSA